MRKAIQPFLPVVLLSYIIIVYNQWQTYSEVLDPELLHVKTYKV